VFAQLFVSESMSKLRAVVRQWTLLRVLSQQRNGLSISEMAKHMAVNERTIRRDISLFVQAGVPLRETVGRRGRKAWRVDDRAQLIVPSYTIDEALVLVVAEQLLTPFQDSRVYSAARRCREKILSSLSGSEQAIVNKRASELQCKWEKQIGKCLKPSTFEALLPSVEALL
jgi:predicted DNA-binding transcriptional regulator YafY